VIREAAQRRARYELHSALGALTGVLLFVISYTGALSLFRDELELWAQPARQLSAGPVKHGPDAVFQALREGEQAGDSVLIRFPEISHGAWDVVTQPKGSPILRVRFDPQSGRELPAAANDMAGAVFRLHAYLLVPGLLGRYFVGILGLAMLASLWTGLRVRRHLWRDAAQRPRTHQSRLWLTDVHRMLGVWVLPFHALIALTGVYLGVRGLAVVPALWGRFEGDAVRARAAMEVPGGPRELSASLPRIEELIERARREVPDLQVNAVLLRAWERPTAQVTVMGQLRGVPLLPRHEGVRVVFSGADGALLGVRNAVASGPLVRVYHALGPLHFGEFGGWLTRPLYFVLGLASGLMALAGTLIWAERRARSAP
jgi:uncharacterized iron-regulated membrane protein